MSSRYEVHLLIIMEAARTKMSGTRFFVIAPLSQKTLHQDASCTMSYYEQADTAYRHSYGVIETFNSIFLK